MRAGIGAAVPNPVGDTGVLNAMADALAAARVPASGPFGGVARNAGQLADEASSLVAGAGASLDKSLTYAGSRADALRQLHYEEGVDTDAEMSSLLVLQTAYTANAKVISALDEMMQTLLGI